VKKILIRKASGEPVPFSEEKLRTSLLRSGASMPEATGIAKDIKAQLYPGVTTRQIHRWAIGRMRKKSPHSAGRYMLKRGIMELGPSGFPFEKFVAEILKREGYSTLTAQIVNGRCVSHEVDVIAEKDDHHFMIECKYHNHPGTVCDVKIPLYIHARFKDIEPVWTALPGHSKKLHQGWVVTNTRFTVDAVKYGTCAGLNLIGWDYPNGGSLRSRIDALGLYPVTCITSLTKYEKQLLLDEGIVLAKDVRLKPELLKKSGISDARMQTVLQEIGQLCAMAERTEAA
jgi:hypothetical protein